MLARAIRIRAMDQDDIANLGACLRSRLILAGSGKTSRLAD
jgi:hypothetical protein